CIIYLWRLLRRPAAQPAWAARSYEHANPGACQDLSQSTSLSGGARLTQAVVKAVREGFSLLLAALGVIVFLALASYHAGDPGWSYSGDGGEVRNLVGPLGALVADLLFFLFGRPAYLLPAMLLVAAWLVFRNRVDSLKPASRANVALRIAGF